MLQKQHSDLNEEQAGPNGAERGRWFYNVDVLWASTVVQRQNHAHAEHSKNIVRIELRVVALPDIVNNLGHEQQSLDQQWPDFVGEEVHDGEVGKQTEIYIRDATYRIWCKILLTFFWVRWCWRVPTYTWLSRQWRAVSCRRRHWAVRVRRWARWSRYSIPGITTEVTSWAMRK